MIPFLLVVAVAVVIVLVTPKLSAMTFVALKGSDSFDSLIARVAASKGIKPHFLKAIIAQESGFDPDAINPEQQFTLQGQSYPPGSRAGRAALREFLKSGGSLDAVKAVSTGKRLNPSIGLAQVRVTIARSFVPGVTPRQLFQPEINLRASAGLLQELFRAGITLDTIDAYNVGQDLRPRNLAYRDRVRQFALSFQKDFA